MVTSGHPLRPSTVLSKTVTSALKSFAFPSLAPPSSRAGTVPARGGEGVTGIVTAPTATSGCALRLARCRRARMAPVASLGRTTSPLGADRSPEPLSKGVTLVSVIRRLRWAVRGRGLPPRSSFPGTAGDGATSLWTALLLPLRESGSRKSRWATPQAARVGYGQAWLAPPYRGLKPASASWRCTRQTTDHILSPSVQP